MRRLLIGLSILALASPALAQSPLEVEARRLLSAAIAKARSPGPQGFRLRCAAGCSRPRETLRSLRVEDMVRVSSAPCRDPRAACYRIELDASTPPRWYILELEARGGGVRRVEILGP
jgi:hypothetical protein